MDSERESRLEDVVSMLRKSKEGLETMLHGYKQQLKEMEGHLANTRKDYLSVMQRELAGQRDKATLESEVESLQYQLKCMKEKTERTQSQFESLQNYLAEANQIREQFDANRIAKDQVKIMQELKMENVDLNCKVKEFEANQMEVQLLSNSIIQLKQELQTARDAKSEAYKQGFNEGNHQVDYKEDVQMITPEAPVV